MFEALAAAAAGFLSFILLSYLKNKKNETLKLRPNCLLTRHPIVVVLTPYSIRRWNPFIIQPDDFLRAHGYDVVSATSSSCQNILKYFQQMQRPYHLMRLTDPGLDVNPEKCLDYAISLAERDLTCSH